MLALGLSKNSLFADVLFVIYYCYSLEITFPYKSNSSAPVISTI